MGAFQDHILQIISYGVILIVLFNFVNFLFKKRSGNEDEALDILQQRYARGEINRDTYLSMKEDLKQ